MPTSGESVPVMIWSMAGRRLNGVNDNGLPLERRSWAIRQRAICGVCVSSFEYELRWYAVIWVSVTPDGGCCQGDHTIFCRHQCSGKERLIDTVQEAGAPLLPSYLVSSLAFHVSCGDMA